jgi:carboxylate-amine ligase
VADVCFDPTHTVTIAALVRALVETATQEWMAGIAAPDVSSTAIRLASWTAARSGIRAQLVDPLSGSPRWAADVVHELFGHVRPALEAAGDADLVSSGLERLLAEGTGADWQRGVFAETGRVEDVVLRAALSSDA